MTWQIQRPRRDPALAYWGAAGIGLFVVTALISSTAFTLLLGYFLGWHVRNRTWLRWKR